MKKSLLATLAASTIFLAGCGSTGPAPEAGTGEWSEVDDIGVRVNVQEFPALIHVDINNHRSKQIDREVIELVSIEGERVDEELARDTFNEEFVNDISGGEEYSGTFVSGTGDNAKMTVSVDGIEFPFNLSD